MSSPSKLLAALMLGQTESSAALVALSPVDLSTQTWMARDLIIYFSQLQPTGGLVGRMLYAAAERVLASLSWGHFTLSAKRGWDIYALPLLLFDSNIVTQECTWHFNMEHHRFPIGAVRIFPVSSAVIATFCSVRGFHDP